MAGGGMGEPELGASVYQAITGAAAFHYVFLLIISNAVLKTFCCGSHLTNTHLCVEGTQRVCNNQLPDCYSLPCIYFACIFLKCGAEWHTASLFLSFSILISLHPRLSPEAKVHQFINAFRSGRWSQRSLLFQVTFLPLVQGVSDVWSLWFIPPDCFCWNKKIC